MNSINYAKENNINLAKKKKVGENRKGDPFLNHFVKVAILFYQNQTKIEDPTQYQYHPMQNL